MIGTNKMSETVITASSTAEVVYPPAPWSLTGQLYGSIWTVPEAAFECDLAPAFVPLVNFGRIGVFAGFVDYQAGSILTYHELIAGVVVRLKGRRRYALNVTHIWVDDEASRQGGRAIWGVPKELASFGVAYAQNNRNFQGTAQAQSGQNLAQGDFQAVLGLTQGWRVPTPFPNLQILHDRPHYTSGTFWSAIQFCKGGMRVEASSPLAALGIAGRKPLLSFGGRGFKMTLQAARPVGP